MDKAEASRILKRLREYNSDIESTLVQIEDIRRMSVEGFDTEVPGKEGAMLVTQKTPAVGVQALQLRMNVIKFLVEQAGEAEEQQGLTLSINVVALEDSL